MDATFGVRILENDSGNVLFGKVRFENILNFDFDLERFGSSFYAADGLGMKLVG